MPAWCILCNSYNEGIILYVLEVFLTGGCIECRYEDNWFWYSSSDIITIIDWGGR